MIRPTQDNTRAAGAVVLAMAAVTASDAMVKGLLEEIAPIAISFFVRALSDSGDSRHRTYPQ